MNNSLQFNCFLFVLIFNAFPYGEFIELFVKPANFRYKIQLHCPLDEFTRIDIGTALQKANEEKAIFDIPFSLLEYCFEQKLTVRIFKFVENNESDTNGPPNSNFEFIKKFALRSTEANKVKAMVLDVSEGMNLPISLGQSPAEYYFTVIIKCQQLEDQNANKKMVIFATAISSTSQIESMNIGNMDQLEKCQGDTLQIEVSKGAKWKLMTMLASEFRAKLGECLHLNFKEMLFLDDANAIS
uniref:Uncharacterized protein n=1 Tax=Globodera rostochiensis TaxID=31243 RepID=A0A914HX96_GLORO